MDMNNQVKLIDADKILWELALQGFMTDDIKWKIDAGEFDPDTPPVPTIKQGDRDWQKDMEWAQIISDAGEYKAWTEPLIYWLQQYAATKEELAKINCDYYADKQRFVVQRRELEESKAREKKLREAMEETINEALTLEDAITFLNDVLASLYPKEETKP